MSDLQLILIFILLISIAMAFVMWIGDNIDD